MNPIQIHPGRLAAPVFLRPLGSLLMRACPRMLALAALGLFADPGVSRADTIDYWTVTGTQAWTSDRTVTGTCALGTVPATPAP